MRSYGIMFWDLEHIRHVGKISLSGYKDRRYKRQMHQYVMSLEDTFASVNSAEKLLPVENSLMKGDCSVL